MEDNETDVYVIREVLNQCGFEVHLHVVRNGLDAVSYLQRAGIEDGPPCPGMVLLDLNVPKIDGIEVLRRLRMGSRCSRTPVVIVSSSDSGYDRDAVQRLGVDAYFRKPSDLAAYGTLAAIVKKVLTYKQ